MQSNCASLHGSCSDEHCWEAYLRLVCQKALGPLSIHPKPTNSHGRLLHPQLLMAAEDLQVAADSMIATLLCAIKKNL